MSARLSRGLVALMLAAAPESVAAQAPPADEPGVQWAEPATVPPELPSGPVGSLPDTAPPANPGRPSPYLGLRALSISEGEARIQTRDGARTLRAGDLLGRDVVKAVDTGVLVLERKAAPGAKGGDARVVIRFDAQGKPTVRIYHVEDPTRVEPRPTN
jgi:hypothetical protein